jgi:hypothetical protein
VGNGVLEGSGVGLKVGVNVGVNVGVLDGVAVGIGKFSTNFDFTYALLVILFGLFLREKLILLIILY